ncbi:Proteins of 100 residues with WXG [Nocardioides exalbidus]|uniref:Proteins of 100 residues with WXG n=1 Tax=Nocardioides exalbidus TaxID=402596 RepID=A0A1H4KMV1_9ACTN|nr:WXG100 family type VII secretion target [Nocardioides exalbidus]SEB59425.1 Proteins of 100 residues with WXG [Nocardioides exalbidus]
MTAFDIDLDELRAAVRELGACHRDLLALAAEVDRTQAALGEEWLGVAADAERTAYADWRGHRDEMVTALSALRGIADAADGHYSRAVDANLARWRLVRA